MKKIRSFLWVGLLIILTLSVILNIKTQYSTLREARRKNDSLGRQIKDFEEKNQRLVKQIEYATDSAFVNQQVHDNLALGTENDVWLVMPTEVKVDLRPEVNEDGHVPNYQQWLDLFTR